MPERGDRFESGAGGDRRSDEADAFTYRIDADETPSEAVVAAVASWSRRASDDRDGEVEDADRPGSAVDPLYRVVDPDSLDALFRPTGEGARRRRGLVAFAFGGYDVTVIDGTRIEGRPLASEEG